MKLNAHQMRILKKIADGEDYKTIATKFKCSRSSISENVRIMCMVNNCKNAKHLVATALREKVIA